MFHATKRLALVLSLTTFGCNWDDVPVDDAGHDAWVMQAIPTVLGRQPASVDEVRALSAVAQDRGRRYVLRKLMRQPAYERYWAQVIIDRLELSIDPGIRASIDSDCLTPESSDPDLTYLPQMYDSIGGIDRYRLMSWMRDGDAIFESPAPPDAAPDGVSFLQLVELAVDQDHLEGVFTAFMPVLMASVEQGSDEGGARARAGDTFTDRYLGRDMTCLECHTTRYSVSGGTHFSSDWNRHHPTVAPTPDGRADHESVLFSYLRDGSLKEGAYGGYHAQRHVRHMMHSGVFIGGGDPINPYALLDACVTRKNTPNDSGTHLRLPQFSAQQNGSQVNPSFGSLHPATLEGSVPTDLSALSLVPYLLDGIDGLHDPWAISVPPRLPPVPHGIANEAHDWAIDQVEADAWYQVIHECEPEFDNCDDLWEDYVELGMIEDYPDYYDQRVEYLSQDNRVDCANACHSSNGFLSNVPNDKLTHILKYGKGDMPGNLCEGMGVTEDECIALTIRHLRGTSAANSQGEILSLVNDPPDRLMNPEESFAILVAEKFVNMVIAEVTGNPMVLDHGFARTEEQAQILAHLTDVFVSGRWSLEDLLMEILDSSAFNRNDPDASGTVAYSLPILSNPMSMVRGATDGPDRYNGQGDLVHRWSVSHLVEKVHHALGWPSGRLPAPKNSGGYPTTEHLWSLGDYRSFDSPAIDETTLPTWLAWENLVGSCEKPALIVRDPSNPGHPETGSSLIGPGEWEDWIDALMADGVGVLTREQALRMIKDRILTDPVIDAAEAAVLTDMVGDPLSTPLQAGDMELMRNYCGVLLTTPQFMLGGLASADDVDAAMSVPLPERPAYRDEPVDVAGWCDYYGGDWDGTHCEISITHEEVPHQLRME